MTKIIRQLEAGMHASMPDQPTALAGGLQPARRAWTIAETATALGLSERTVWRQIGLGNLDVVKFGRATRVLVASVDRLLKAGEVTR